MKTECETDSEEHPLLEGEDERSCCDKTSSESGEPEKGCASKCVTSWKDEEIGAKSELDQASATAQKAEWHYKYSFEWETKLRKWKDDAEKAHEKALDVFGDVELFHKAVARIRTGKTAKALEALLCLVKKIFDGIHELLRAEGALSDLKHKIKCGFKGQPPEKLEEALKCIVAFEDHIKGIYEQQKALITKLLEILHCADVITAAMDEPTGKPNLGLLWQMSQLRNRLLGIATAAKKGEACKGTGSSSPPEPPCGKEISNPSEQLLPIRKMPGDDSNSKDSPYYKRLTEQYENARKDSETQRENMTKARQERDKAMARYSSLKEAIAAADAAEAAK